MKGFKFVETAGADILAGRGGDGCASFRREKYIPFGGPDGGDGGRGGHVILQADPNVDSLIAVYYQPRQHAEDGGKGMGKKQHGRNGKDLILKVPCGTVAQDETTGEILGDLVTPGEQLMVARGGKGGLGNCHWKTSTYQAPIEHTKGEPGEQRRLRLDLKIVADIGLIGFPNAGKSTLLTAISHAHPKIAAYPFTTLQPVIGTIQYDTFDRLKLVDIPGLICGAHAGAGLGHTFLRHVERTRGLVYVIDMAGADGRHPADDYLILRDELNRYNPALLQRPALIVANKMDLDQALENLPEFIVRTGQKPRLVSGLARQGTEELKNALYDLVVARDSLPPPSPKTASAE
ncbi:MAG: GTPase ObgE [Kiritimatiellae bacterium]|nr:GTPase ObgE [Kiritimatiellia bacterium]